MHLCSILIMYMAGISNTPIVLSQEEKEFIDGALLGDGHITKPKGRSSQFSYVTSKQTHAEYVYQKLKRLAVGECLNGPTKSLVFDKRTNKTYTSYRFRSVSNITFFELRNRWYPDGNKVIPNDVVLSPITTLIWYLGDGSLMKAKRSYYIKLSTNGFQKENVESVLFPQISTYNPSFVYATKSQWWVYIPRRNIDKFLKFIGDCPVSEYDYKWKFDAYKRDAYRTGTVTKYSLVEDSILTDYKNCVTLWKLNKKYGVEYNLIKYHITRYERSIRRPHQKSV